MVELISIYQLEEYIKLCFFLLNIYNMEPKELFFFFNSWSVTKFLCHFDQVFLSALTSFLHIPLNIYFLKTTEVMRLPATLTVKRHLVPSYAQISFQKFSPFRKVMFREAVLFSEYHCRKQRILPNTYLPSKYDPWGTDSQILENLSQWDLAKYKFS